MISCIIESTENMNQLATMWWQPYETAYPTLAKLAKKYISPCTSSCASERLFSTCGHIEKSLLKPDKLNMLVLLAKNLN